jgi:uncharacterized membrane protein YgdD (TMEM256/DUF423 family)
VIDDSLSRRIIICAAVSGALGIALGSFGAHGLERFLELRGLSAELIEKRAGQFDVGVHYHLIHSLALLALASLPFGSPAIRLGVCRLFVLGIVLFSGSLYALAITNLPVLGMITPPIGGLCWIFGWALLVLTTRRSHS